MASGASRSIARHIVEGHGGAIRVESEEGRGATFAFTVPISDAIDRRDAVAAAAASSASAATTRPSNV